MNLIERLRDWASARYEVQLTEVSDMQSACEEAADEIERLTNERDALRELMNCYNLGGWTDAERLQKERDKARSERDALRLDAERYRWLREQVKFPGTRTAAQAMLWNCSFSRSKFDALTDAARKEKP